MSVLPNRSLARKRLTSLLAATTLAVPLALAVSLPSHAADSVDSAKVGLYGSADPTYDGVFRQSVAVLGILAAGDQPADDAVTWLLDQQCADGGFMSFNPTPNKPCVAPDPASFSGEDTNSTALAAQALTALGHGSEAAAATGFLADAKNSDGGWPYIPGGDSDPNSTGVVQMAMSASGDDVEQATVDYLAGLQVDCSGDAADQGGFTTAFSGGAPDVLATVQAVPGVMGLHLDQLPPASGQWADDLPAFTCPVDNSDADTVGGWGAAWLETQAQGGAVTGGNAAWAVLAFAATRTGHDEAQDLYTGLLQSVGGAKKTSSTTLLAQSNEDPGLLGLTSLAGVALGEDVSSLAGRIAATVTEPQAQPTPSPTPSKSGNGGHNGNGNGGGTGAGGETLPDTGTTPGLVLLGAALVAAGGLLMVVTRRRRPTA